jgi:hypothetical protein
MCNEFNDYVFFVLSSQKKDILPTSTSYKTDKKKVLIFISEESGVIPEYLSPYYYSIFKAYMPCVDGNKGNIFNFPLQCVGTVPVFPYIPIPARKYSVFFSGNLNGNRLPLYLSFFCHHLALSGTRNVLFKGIRILSEYQLIKKIMVSIDFSKKFSNSYIRFSSGFSQGLPAEQYGKIIAESKIVLCPRGFCSTECFRHYEAMRAGCIIISEQLPKTYFYNNSPIIQIQNWTEGLQRAKELLNNPAAMEKTSAETKAWWETKCSEKAIANYLYDCLKTRAAFVNDSFDFI